MLTTLQIKNFGPIKEANIEIKPITILIGEQAAGKSTIAKLIAMFNDEEFINSNQTNFEKSLKKYNIQNYLQPKTELNCEKTLFPSIYIPAERFLVSVLNNAAIEFMNNSLTLPKSVTQFGTYYQKARQEINETSIKFLNIQYFYNNGQDLIKNKNKMLSLSESASGFQSVVPLFLVIEYFSKQNMGKTFIVEEPELNIYPKMQYELISFLAKCANENNHLVITTHSPYVLTSLNNLLFAGQIETKEFENELSQIIPSEFRILPENFIAYHVAKGKVKQVFNPKTKLISETELDIASEIINADFSKLMNIYKKSK